MPNSLMPWCGDIHHVVSLPAAGVITTLASVICGAIIGIERQRAQKPAGLRTLILICLGATIFTQASILMASQHADRTRIAAQVVAGIGFLGAGAIIRERGTLIGLTTGAGIWATAAVGVTLGAGFVVAGIFFSILILATLSAAPIIDRVVAGPCRMATLHIEFDPDHGRTRLRIQAIMDEHVHSEPVQYDESTGGPSVARIRYCQAHRDHRLILPDLIELTQIKSVRQD